MNKMDDALKQAQKIAGVEITDKAREVLNDSTKIAQVLAKLDQNDIAMLTAIVSGTQTSIDPQALMRIKALLGE